MSDSENAELLYEADKMLRLEEVKCKMKEWKLNREEKKLRDKVYEEEKKLRLEVRGGKKREWILKNENDTQLRLVQALLKDIIGAVVDASEEYFNMRKIKKEVIRIERLEKRI